MTGVRAQNPASEGASSLEMRWIFPGRAGTEVVEWRHNRGRPLAVFGEHVVWTGRSTRYAGRRREAFHGAAAHTRPGTADVPSTPQPS
jgi:hypothetical protein